ncbi:hypothetical protein D3C86_1726610 [compost metagenome]
MSASEELDEGKLVSLVGTRFAAAQKMLHLLVQLAADQGLMLTMVDLALVAEVAIVDGVLEHQLD